MTDFVSARAVTLAVRQTSTITLYRKFPSFIEFTFAHLRYSLGGDRPSQTASYTVFLNIIQIRNSS